MVTKEAVVQWFCGFYEGEGWVCSDKGNNNRLRLGIAQNDKTPLDIGLSLWGGTIKKRVRKSPASDKICTGYEWNLPHAKALIFLKDIEPYMLIPVKKEQVNKALELFANGDKCTYKCAMCDNMYANPSARSRHVKHKHQHPDASSAVALQEGQIAGTS